MAKQDKRVRREKKSYKPAKENEIQKSHQKVLKSVGKRIEAIREEKNISVSEMCKKVGISRTTYYRIINGMVYFNTEKLFKIADYLNADVSIELITKSNSR